MQVLNRKSFKLPFVGKDKFVRLTRVGLGYDGGSFHVRDNNNVEKIVDIISDVLGEKVSFFQTCVLCGQDFLCSGCRHQDLCPTKDLPLQCICENCRATPKLYDQYVKNLGSGKLASTELR